MEYNKLQQVAINHNADKIMVIAPPGSGKTATMVGAIEKYRKDHPVDAITAITFTRKAAAELTHKTMGMNVEASTIHSWSLKELNKLAARYKFKVNILQDRQIQEILLSICKSCGFYTIQQYTLFAYVMGNFNIDIPQSSKNKYEKVYRQYVHYKRSNHLYDFTDLPLYLFDILSHYNETINTIDGLFVDEFQDVDWIQAQIFTKVMAKKHFYIADPDQSIYIFRGATEDILTKLNGFTILRLNENYRSCQKIVDFATAARETNSLSEVRDPDPSWIKCVRQDEEGEVFNIGDQEGYDIVRKRPCPPFRTLEYFMLKHPFILCRSNKQVKKIQECGYHSVSTIHQAKGLEYPNVIVVDFSYDTDEERNVAYVACTRAEDGLLICDFDTLYTTLPMILHNNELEFGQVNLF